MASHIGRRKFLAALGGAAVARPLAARAQQPAKLPTIGFLGVATPSTWSHQVAAFVQRLRDLGWIEGRTVAIEYRWTEGRNDRLAEIAAEIARLKVDVIVTAGPAAITAAGQATPAFVDGGLISYGPDRVGEYRRAASYIDRILKGEKPADLPVQTPTKYQLVINLKAAKALGLEVPATVLARADEVIE